MSIQLTDLPKLTDADVPDAREMAFADERIRRWNPAPGSEMARLMQKVMTQIEAWRSCEKSGCRRASRCTAPRVDCFARHHAFVRNEVRPRLVAALQSHGETSEGAPVLRDAADEAAPRNERPARRFPQ